MVSIKLLRYQKENKMKAYRKRFLQNGIALAVVGATLSFSGYSLANTVATQSQTPVMQNAVVQTTMPGYSFKNAFRGGYYGFYGPSNPLYYAPRYYTSGPVVTGHWVFVPHHRYWVKY